MSAQVLIFSRTAAGVNDAAAALGAAGYELIGQCGDWREALASAHQTSPDLIVAVIPARGAADWAEQAHRLGNELVTPVVFIEGSGPDGHFVLPPDWSDRFQQALRPGTSGPGGDACSAPFPPLYRAVFEQHPLPMWVFEPATLRIRAVNRAACVTYGYRREEFLGLLTSEITPADSALASPTDCGQPTGFGESVHRRKGGALFPVRLAVCALPGRDSRMRLAVVEVRAEQDASAGRIDRTQRLEGLGLLTLGLAHDLNNILAPVLFVGPLLRASTSPEETARYVDSLEVSAQRGANMVRQIMALAQGATTVRLPSTLRHIVRDVITGLTHVIAGNIRTEALLPAESWPAEIDPTGIYQVVLNLCRNACDAMPQGGLLRVELSNHLLPTGPADQPAARHRGPWLCLSVSDTGTGIPAPVLERMWEPFYSTKPAGRGTGVGLSGVRGIIDAHQGFIEVQTREGTGSCFKVYLPALPEMAAQGEPVREPMPRGASELVLLVEDDATLREMLGSVLQCSGYRVIACRDGVEAIVQYNAHAAEVALVLTDITMPQLNGAVLAQMLRKLNPALPILILTGLSDDVPVDRELADAQAAASDYAHKSIAPERLLEKVRALVESRRRG